MMITGTAGDASWKENLVDSNKKLHYFLGSDHDESEIRTWAVIILCFSSMVIEIALGIYFGSLAVVAGKTVLTATLMIIILIYPQTAYTWELT